MYKLNKEYIWMAIIETMLSLPPCKKTRRGEIASILDYQEMRDGVNYNRAMVHRCGGAREVHEISQG